jgi:predicted phage terminase large subunit-like protein
MARLSTKLDPHELIHVLEKRDNARAHLADYSRYVMEVTPAAHHELICEAIDELLADLYDELIILAPPGSAKSTYTSLALPGYFLGHYPKGHILTASYSVELAEKWGRKVRNYVDSPRYNAVFPDTTLSKDSTSAGRWATAQGGEFYAAGVGSGILGFRADLALIDDPISGFEQAQSITQLTKIHEWYETDFITRLKPQGKVILICQRLARNDLAGYLIDRNEANPTRRQRILVLPMIANSPDDPLGREIGERLWPEWFTPQMVADAQRDEYKWKTLYQQEPPADTGSWAGTDDFRFAPTPKYDPATYSYYGLTDLALSVNTGDYTVHLVVAAHKQTQDCHVVDCYRKRVDPDESSDAMVALSQTYKPSEWLIDDDNSSKVWMQLVATRARQSNVPVMWKPLPMRGQNKETRAAPLRGMFKRGMIYFDPNKPWTNVIINECLQFPNALGQGVDDCVDALALIGRRLASLSYAGPKAEAKVRPTRFNMTLKDLWADQPRRSDRI